MSPHPSPVVSIVTPAYDAARHLGETIDSVQAQTFGNWELIVVDDQSKDGTAEVAAARAAADGRIRVERSPRNQGPGPSRNQALALARGRYVAFLDADDLWDPQKLERQVRFMRSRSAAFSFTGYRIVTEAGEPAGSLGPVPESVGYLELLESNPIGCLTVMLDRERVGEVRFPPLRTNQDFALWLDILRSGVRAQGLDEELASYRIVGTSNTRSKLRSARGVWRVYRRQRLSWPRTLWLYAHYVVNGTRKHVRTGAYAAARTGKAAR